MKEADSNGSRPGWRRVGGFALRLLCYYAAVVAFFALWQRRLIYQPTRRTCSEAEVAAAAHGWQAWRHGDGRIIGWQRPATGQPTGAVLILHGNAGSAADRDYLAEPIADAASVDVFVLEYPGYGCRSGRPSEQSLLEAAEEAFRLLSGRAPLYLVSESLGTGPATWLAGRYPDQVAGLMLFMPYNRFVEVARRHMPFLPTGLMLRDRYDPGRWLAGYRGPVGILLAGADEVIPAVLGRALHDGYGGPKKLWEVAGARHNDVAAQSAEWWRGVFDFWMEGRDGKQSSPASRPPGDAPR